MLSLPHQDHVYRITDELVCFHNKNSMKCVVNWIPLRIRVRSRSTQPHLQEKQAWWCLLVCEHLCTLETYTQKLHFALYNTQNVTLKRAELFRRAYMCAIKAMTSCKAAPPNTKYGSVVSASIMSSQLSTSAPCSCWHASGLTAYTRSWHCEAHDKIWSLWIWSTPHSIACARLERGVHHIFQKRICICCVFPFFICIVGIVVYHTHNARVLVV